MPNGLSSAHKSPRTCSILHFMSSSLDQARLKAREQQQVRDSHIRWAHELLEVHGVQWSASRVTTLVKKYLASQQQLPLSSYIAEAVAQQLKKTTSNPKCITYVDRTGDEAAFWADNPDIERNEDMPRYGTIKETATAYGLSETTVRRYIAAGRINAQRVGPRLIRIDLEQAHRELFGNNDTAA